MALTDEDLSRIATLVGSITRESESRTSALIAESEARTAEKIEATETKLLTAFHQWASPMESRVRSHSAAIRALDLDCEALDERLRKLEPPH